MSVVRATTVGVNSTANAERQRELSAVFISWCCGEVSVNRIGAAEQSYMELYYTLLPREGGKTIPSMDEKQRWTNGSV